MMVARTPHVLPMPLFSRDQVHRDSANCIMYAHLGFWPQFMQHAGRRANHAQAIGRAGFSVIWPATALGEIVQNPPEVS